MKKFVLFVLALLIFAFSGCENTNIPAENIPEDEIVSKEPEQEEKTESEQEEIDEKPMFNDIKELLMYQISLYEKANYGAPINRENGYSEIWKVGAIFINDIDTAGRKVDKNAEVKLISEYWLDFVPAFDNLRYSDEPLETEISVKESQIGEDSARIVVSRKFRGDKLWDCEYVFVKAEATKEILESEAKVLVIDGCYWKYESVTPLVSVHPKEIVISTPEELIEVCEKINYGDASAVNGKFVLGNDIDMSGYEWDPMGKEMDFGVYTERLAHAKINTGFNGEFDGAGYTISGINVSKNSVDERIGFFGTIGPFGYVHDLTVTGNIGSGDYGEKIGYAVGGFAGVIHYGARVENCGFEGTVKGNSYVGGFAGDVGYAPYSSGECYPNKTTVTNCYAKAEITASSICGGFAGEIDGVVSGCEAAGNLYIVPGPFRPNIIGGFVGGLSSDIENCRSAVAIHYDVDAPDWMGNFVGELVWEIKIKDCKVDTDNLREGWRLVGMQHYKNCEIDIAKEDWYN